MGTPVFLAPERFAGGADDGRSDVFSVGAMLYQMICDKMPWSAQDQLRMAWGLAQNTPPPPLADHRRGVPPELEALVWRSLAWEAGERPTAQELAAALDRLADSLDDSPTDMVQPSPLAEVERTVRTPSPAEGERVPGGSRLAGVR
jgi:serine/threonine-protein kinase